MGKMIEIEQSFIIDKLTNSIRNTISGDSFQTEISILKKSDLKVVTKKNGWSFNWRIEYNDLYITRDKLGHFHFYIPVQPI